jgi:hypothetical protein
MTCRSGVKDEGKFVNASDGGSTGGKCSTHEVYTSVFLRTGLLQFYNPKNPKKPQKPVILGDWVTQVDFLQKPTLATQEKTRKTYENSSDLKTGPCTHTKSIISSILLLDYGILLK